MRSQLQAVCVIWMQYTLFAPQRDLYGACGTGGNGAMSAVLGMDATVIEDVLNGREGVSIANYNCPGQIVITGKAESSCKGRQNI